jgi:hypothetical protein
MVPTMSNTAIEPITCQPWCESGDGHPGPSLRDGQSCLGVEHKVTLSTESTELMADGSTGQGYATTYLMQHTDFATPRVFIGHDDADGAVATLEEARRFALEILSLVDEQRDITH